MNNQKILLVGAGEMASDYARILRYLDKEFIVVGRGLSSANNFNKEIGIIPKIGGLNKFLSSQKHDLKTAIIATSTDSLMSNLLLLLKHGFKKILIEKPAGLSIDELIDNESKILKSNAKVFVAYNRRFYSSVLEAEKLIDQDGGLESMFFEFTEWLHVIEENNFNKSSKENWFFVNSTHVIDLAFFLAGDPIKWSSYTKRGNVDWHPTSQFCGSGLTKKNILFSYLSNWESAGRWSVELLTRKRRIYLKPLEKIFIQKRGEILLNEHIFSNSKGNDFKEGLLNQVRAFFDNDFDRFVNIENHISNCKKIYKKMLNLNF